jgi:hypothetical protein
MIKMKAFASRRAPLYRFADLSCNFFRGSFDKKVYLDFIDDAFADLQEKRLAADTSKKFFAVNV